MDLLCCEREYECRAYADPVLLNDERVLQNLLKTEERYSPSSSYFENLQKEITPPMRKIVGEWMLEVCEDQKCQEEVFPLAMNYLDRFLSVCAITKNQLQLLGTVCLMLASKLRESRPVPAEVLVYYTDNSIAIDQVWQWELLVLAKLKWDVSAVTPQDFLRHLLMRLPVNTLCWDEHMIRRHAQTFIALCARDYKFSMYTPSMIASASLAAALQGLGWTTKSDYTLDHLLNCLQGITSIERDYLQVCLNQIEEMIASTVMAQSNVSGNGAAQGGGQVGSDGPGGNANAGHGATDKMIEHGKAGTPTDVRDIHF